MILLYSDEAVKEIPMSSSSSSIPHLFRCPISLELFTEPVTLSTGQTYDRPFIEKWLSAGNFTCPVTMQKLTDLSLVPNHTLTHLIHQWRISLNNHSSTLPSLHPDDDDSDFMADLKRTLEENPVESEPGWEEKKLQAVRKVQALSLTLQNSGEEEKENCLVKLGFFPVLINLAFTEGLSGDNLNGNRRTEIVEVALSAAVKLMPFCEDLTCLNKSKFESFIIRHLEQGNSGIKISLCRILETTATLSSSKTKELFEMFSTSDEVISGLVNTIELDRDCNFEADSDDYYDDDNDDNVLSVSEAGVKAILSFCTANSQQQQDQEPITTVHIKLVKHGAIGRLIRFIHRDITTHTSSDSWVSAAAALEAVEVLVRAEGGKDALLNEPNGVRVLVQCVFRVMDHHHHYASGGGSESAVKCLTGICIESREAREEAVRSGVVRQLLLLIQSQCSGRTKARGRMMLKMLRTLWGKEENNGSWKRWCGVG